MTSAIYRLVTKVNATAIATMKASDTAFTIQIVSATKKGKIMNDYGPWDD